MKNSDNLHMDVVCNTDDSIAKLKFVDDIAKLLARGDMDDYNNLSEWLRKWHNDEIPGEKITISMFEMINNSHDIVGVIRLWKSPYCNEKWLIEGLEVEENSRRKGYGERLISKGIEELMKRNIKNIYANIHNKNNPSISLHEKLGFELESEGCNNSFGDLRENNNQYKLHLFE